MKTYITVRVAELVVGSAELDKWGTLESYETDLEESLHDGIEAVVEEILDSWSLKEDDESVHVTVILDSERGPFGRMRDYDFEADDLAFDAERERR